MQWLTCLLLLALSGASFAAPTPAVIGMMVNEQNKGSYTVLLDEDGTWLVLASDLKDMGLTTKAPVVAVEGKAYQRLSTLPGVRFSFDEATLTAQLNAEAAAFDTQRISLSTSRKVSASPAARASGFINYELTGNSAPGVGPSLSVYGAVLAHDFLFSGETFHQSGESAYNTARMRVSREWAEDMVRMEAGDLSADSASGGSSLQLRGLSLFRSFDSQPYFQRSPSTSFSGSVEVPAQAEVYVDGVLVRTVALKPGLYELDSLRYGAGLHGTEVVVRDRAGNVLSRSNGSVYFPASGLAQGLTDYGLNLGVKTTGTGRGDRVVQGRYAWGISDHWTTGLFAQLDGGSRYAGLANTLTLGTAGTVTSQVTQAGGGVSGQAWLFGYNRQARHVSFSVSAEQLGPRYTKPLSEASVLRSRSLMGSVVYSMANGRALSFSANEQHYWNALPWRSLALSYSQHFGSVTVAARVGRSTVAGVASPEAGVNLTWELGRSTYSRAYVTQAAGSTLRGVDVSSTSRGDTGLSYRLSTQQAQSGPLQTTGYAQYDTGVARLSTNVISSGPTTQGSASVASSVVFVDGEVRPSRQVFESFAIVDAVLPGVRVALNNHPMGRTGADGKILLPTLAGQSENQVSLDEQDIPIEYSVDRLRLVVVPPRRSGILVPFTVQRIQAAQGLLRWVDGAGAARPLSSNIRLTRSDGTERLLTPDLQGSFYVEDLPAGQWSGSLHNSTGECHIRLDVPSRELPLLDLKEVRCAAP